MDKLIDYYGRFVDYKRLDKHVYNINKKRSEKGKSRSSHHESSKHARDDRSHHSHKSRDSRDRDHDRHKSKSRGRRSRHHTKLTKEVYDKLIAGDDDLTIELRDFFDEEKDPKATEIIQKAIIEKLNRVINARGRFDIKSELIRFDNKEDGYVRLKDFTKCIKEHLEKMHSNEIYYLAKRYMKDKESLVYYYQMLDEIDYVERGINPLMPWAEELSEYILKAVTAKDTDLETLFNKFSVDRKHLDREGFIKALQEIDVDSKFKLSKIKDFYYYIDENKNGKLELREVENIVKKHCNKPITKLVDPIIDSMKVQLESSKTKIKDVRRIFDGYGRKGLIDAKSFRRAMKTDLLLRFDYIDIDFLAHIYRDKSDKRSVKYDMLIEELKARLGVGSALSLDIDEINKSPERNESSKSRKDLITPSKDNDEVTKILREIGVEAYDRKVKLSKVFLEYSRDGFVTEEEFHRVFRDYNLKIHRDDITRVIERFINTVSGKVDTNAMIRKMKLDKELEDADDGGSTFRNIVDQPIIKKIAKKLEKQRLSHKVIRVIKRKDPRKTHYLTFDQIKGAFHSVNFKLSTIQVTEMLSEIKKNKEGMYNYHILLSALFGTDYETSILLSPSSSKSILKDGSRKKSSFGPKRGLRLDDSSDSDASHWSDSRRSNRHGHSSKHNDRARSKFWKDRDRKHSKHGRSEKRHDDRRSKHGHEKRSVSRPVPLARKGSDYGREVGASRSKRRSRAPLGKQAKEVGKMLEASRYDYIEDLKRYAGDDIDYHLTDVQIFKMLDHAKIRLNRDEKEDFVRDMGDTRFTVEEFLIN